MNSSLQHCQGIWHGMGKNSSGKWAHTLMNETLCKGSTCMAMFHGWNSSIATAPSSERFSHWHHGTTRWLAYFMGSAVLAFLFTKVVACLICYSNPLMLSFKRPHGHCSCCWFPSECAFCQRNFSETLTNWLSGEIQLRKWNAAFARSFRAGSCELSGVNGANVK